MADRSVLMLVVAAVLWSAGGLLLKWVDWNSMAIAGARSAIAAMTIYWLSPRFSFRFSAIQWATAASYVLAVALFVVATRMTTAANAIFLQYTAPIYVALMGGWVLKEPPSRLDWALIGVTQVGIVLFFLDQMELQGLWGSVLAWFSGIGFAGLILLMRKQKDGSPIESVFLGNVLIALLGIPFALGSTPSVRSSIGLLVLGVFQLGVPYVLYAQAIKRVKALEATLILLIEPILNPLWVMWFLGERPGKWALIGGLLVLSAATWRGVHTAMANGR